MMKSYTMDLGGRPLTLEFGEVCKQANGGLLVRYGDTVVVVAATGTKTPREGVDFFPLTVDFEEKMYAVGKIPGGFIKREGRPSTHAVLTSRLIDRPIRPMFPDGYRNDVQIIATAVSVDPDNAPDIPGMIGASAALCVSDIPFEGPIAGVRVGLIDGQYIVNPTVEQFKVSRLNLAVAGTTDAILMVEAGCKEISEQEMLDAIFFAHENIKKICEFISGIQAEIGKPKMEVPKYNPPEELVKEIEEFGAEKLKAALMDANKLQREENVDRVKKEIAEAFIEKYPDNGTDVAYITQKLVKKIVRRTIAVDKIRPDGRALDEVRPVTCRVGLLPRVHGSSLFTRGQTQIMNACTLAPLREAQVIEGLGPEEMQRYIHHYNFPPYSVGETKPLRSPGRREIGHGALAERALLPVIPSEEDFPYTLRLVSEVLESNGSSSMGSVCASTLSLMDAGVPIKAPVAGVAMGLVKDGDFFTILTDIQGLEDALGDMDFKVAGTEHGITAMQMDMKPRKSLSRWAPKITSITVDPEKIAKIIGPGGKTIKKIVEETGAKIDIEDSGKVYIASPDSDAIEKAIKTIDGITAEAEVGKVYTGKVTRIMNFGAFVEILPGKEGMVHISQLSTERVEKVEDVVSVGDEIMVKCVEIDSKGRINLSRKAILQGK